MSDNNHKDPVFIFNDFEDEINHIESHKYGNFLIASS